MRLRRQRRSFFSQPTLPLALVAAFAVVVLGDAMEHAAAQTLAYSFESPAVFPDGFAPNGGGVTVTQDTVGATESMSSLKASMVAGATFAGALTANLPSVIGDPPGVNYVMLDLTLPDAFAGGFGELGVTIFGASQPGPDQQFGLQAQFASTIPLGGKAAGTYRNLVIRLDSATHPLLFTTGQTFNQIFGTAGSGASDVIPTGFQLFVNKSNSAPLAFNIDNVRVGAGAPPPLPTSYSFEIGPTPDNFFGVNAVVTQDVPGTTVGNRAMKVDVPMAQVQAAARTDSHLPALFQTPSIVDHVLFDMTILQPFAGTSANIGVAVFGRQQNQTGSPLALQAKFADTESIAGKAAGTYQNVRIDLYSATNPLTATTNQSFGQIFGSGAGKLNVPTGFQLFIDKSGDAPLAVFIDNVRFVPVPEGDARALIGLGVIAVGVAGRRPTSKFAS